MIFLVENCLKNYFCKITKNMLAVMLLFANLMVIIGNKHKY